VLPSWIRWGKVSMGKQTATLLTTAFYGLWVFIIIVSVADGYLLVRHRHQMAKDELNPVGRMLIVWNGGRVWYLLLAKCVGTILVSTVLQVLLHVCWRKGLVIAGGVALMQLFLLLFLFLA